MLGYNMIDDSVEKEYGNQLRLRVSGLCIKNNRILLINHSGLNSENEFWAPPGGSLHFGESVKECLNREFFEETGLKIDVNDFQRVTEFLNPPLHAIEIFFKVSIIGGTLAKGYDPEVSLEDQIIRNVKFISIKELLDIPDVMKHGIFRSVKNFTDLYSKTGYSKYP